MKSHPRPTLATVPSSISHFALLLAACSTLVAQPNLEFDDGSSPEPNINSAPTLEQQIADYSGSALLRPSRHVGNFESLIVDFVVDGIKGQHMALRGPSLSLKGSVPRDWQQDATLASRYSIALRNRYAPDLLMTFTIFSQNSFALSYDDDDLIAYLAGLRQQHSTRLRLNNMPSDFRDAGFNAHLLGAETVHFDYSVRPREEQGATIRHREYWILIGEHWVEINLIGPEGQVAPAIPTFERFLRNLSVVQNEAEAFGE